MKFAWELRDFFFIAPPLLLNRSPGKFRYQHWCFFSYLPFAITPTFLSHWFDRALYRNWRTLENEIFTTFQSSFDSYKYLISKFHFCSTDWLENLDTAVYTSTNLPIISEFPLNWKRRSRISQSRKPPKQGWKVMKTPFSQVLHSASVQAWYQINGIEI